MSNYSKDRVQVVSESENEYANDANNRVIVFYYQLQWNRIPHRCWTYWDPKVIKLKIGKTQVKPTKPEWFLPDADASKGPIVIQGPGPTPSVSYLSSLKGNLIFHNKSK